MFILVLIYQAIILKLCLWEELSLIMSFVPFSAFFFSLLPCFFSKISSKAYLKIPLSPTTQDKLRYVKSIQSLSYSFGFVKS